MNNSLGQRFIITSFGESHGKCVGIVVDGCPAGLPVTLEDIQNDLNRRKPVSVAGGTARAEEDKAEILSGLFNGVTTGAPICMLIWNKNTDSSAYENIKFTPRPGQADYTAHMKYGGLNDYRGGGRFSGRITAGFVMAGAIAKKILALHGIDVIAHTVQIGDIKAQPPAKTIKRQDIDKSEVRCIDTKASSQMIKLIADVKKEGDSVGGIVEVQALNVPAGLGNPLFNSLEAALSRSLFSIPAVKGVEFGAGFGVASLKGSQNNDPFIYKRGKIVTQTNNAGGILGGISTGMPIIARVAFKPTASIGIMQQTVNLRNKKNVDITVKGRHDACIVPRAVPVVEAMVALTLCDIALMSDLIPEVIK